MIPNEFSEELMKIWDNLEWESKLEYSCPKTNIEYMWHSYSKEEVEKAREILSTLSDEEGDGENWIGRTAHLGSYPSGLAIAICRLGGNQ